MGIVEFIIAAILFLGIDSIWLTATAGYYKKQLRGLIADKPEFVSAGIFYIIYIIGILFFAVQPALNDSSWLVALRNGAMLGLVAYATYDLTNAATLKQWPKRLVVVDLLWGTVLTASVATATYLVAHNWFGL